MGRVGGAVCPTAADSYSSLVLCFPAISWSAVPEHPLDVTTQGFTQGTTKKAIGSLKSRCVEGLGRAAPGAALPHLLTLQVNCVPRPQALTAG